MPNISLNERETQLLKQWLRKGEPDAELHKLLTLLDSLLDDRSGRMMLPDHILERVQVYAFDFGNRMWQALLFGIFKRSLGVNLGRNVSADESGLTPLSDLPE